MSGLNLLVFREDRRRASGKELKAAITAQLEQFCGHFSQRALLTAHLLAGELECGIADSDPQAARACELLTDGIANALLAGEQVTSFDPEFPSPDLDFLINTARALPVLEQLSISTPEGFAYYALHPLAYADVISQLPPCAHLLVVGIRSIGTTLSSVAAAAARARGIVAERITVRPQGHPYNRTVELTTEQMAAVRNAVSRGASFAVIDEGPGLSGSSFLATAEALEAVGAPVEKIILISSHAPNVDALCAENAARRWQRFHCIPVAARLVGQQRQLSSSAAASGEAECSRTSLNGLLHGPALSGSNICRAGMTSEEFSNLLVWAITARRYWIANGKLLQPDSG